jgi:hypothetical protein
MEVSMARRLTAEQERRAIGELVKILDAHPPVNKKKKFRQKQQRQREADLAYQSSETEDERNARLKRFDDHLATLSFDQKSRR